MTAKELQAYRTRVALEIWRRHASDMANAFGIVRMPLLAEKIVIHADVLFVGMNPSFSESALNGLVEEFFPGRSAEEAFAWGRTRSSKRLEAIALLDEKSLVAYDLYYKPLREFAQQVGASSHAHIDMFLVRHTTQKEVGQAHGKTVEALPRFARRQFELFKDTLRALAPKVVVVANAAASRLALEGLDLHTVDGGRSYRWADLPDVPIFLGGMLSGQRALDTFSRNRLACDVADALRARAAG